MMEIPYPLGEIAAMGALRDQIHQALTEHQGDPNAAALDTDLLDIWAAAEPETRAALLLFTAYETRTGTLHTTDDYAAAAYAAELHTHARQHTGTPGEFVGRDWPNMPLTGPAGALASSLTFDRDDLPTSLHTHLLLTTASEAGRP